MNVELGLWPCNFQKRNICFEFSVLVLCSVLNGLGHELEFKYFDKNV
jgi:hypothetical protein